MALTEIPSELSSTPSIVDNGDATAITIGSDESVTFNSTLAVALPVGTTAQRPTGAAGQFRYNSTLSQFEGYTSSWGEIGGGSVDGTTINPSAVQIGGTAVIDSSRNLTNIGTISSGIVTASALQVGDGTDGKFYSDAAGRTAYQNGEFYIQTSVGNCYLYATNTFLGNSTGSTILFRGSAVSHNGFTVSSLGDLSTTRDILSTARNRGVFGTYSSTNTDHIWSMGAAYRNHASGTNFGNLYGLAYKHTNNTTGGTMAGGHMMVWCQNGTPNAAMGSNIWTSGNVTAYSDIRVKTNIEHIPNALDKVCQLNGYTFDRTDVNYDDKGEPDKPVRQTGVIAQEVLEVLPEAVTGDEEGHYSVAYGNMVGLLIESIKELKAEVDDLKAQLEAK